MPPAHCRAGPPPLTWWDCLDRTPPSRRGQGDRDKQDEFDADRRGVELAARAGFDPYGLPGVLQQLRTQAPDNPLFALSLSTHPPAQHRLDALSTARWGGAWMRCPASRW